MRKIRTRSGKRKEEDEEIEGDCDDRTRVEERGGN
jgi:hypothetical protein